MNTGAELAKYIVLICTDQQRADSLGCCGDPIVQTPQLDRLACEGTRVLGHRVTNQICQPSRATLFTGLHPRHHGVLHNGIALNAGADTLPGRLTAAGYEILGVSPPARKSA